MADRTGRQAEVSEQIRVVVVDDHVAVRLGLAGSLGRLPATAGLRVVAQARTAADLKRVLKESACDVIVLDLVLDDASDPAETVAGTRSQRLSGPRLLHCRQSSADPQSTRRGSTRAEPEI